ncbi:hypothetical protein ACFQ6V_23730 [Streptomyces roseifaciens]
MITARITAESRTYQVELAFTDALPVNDGPGEYNFTGLRITYVNSNVTAIRFLADSSDMFASATDLATPGAWPLWLRSLVEQHRPATGECPQCAAPAYGCRIPEHRPGCPWNDPHF